MLAKTLSGPYEAIQEQSIQVQKIKAPARGACREGRPRLKIITLAQDPGKRSLPGRPRMAFQKICLGASCAPARTRRATSFRARQGQGPGKVLAGGSLHCVPALQLIGPRVALGPFQGHVADGCAAWGTRWQATMTRPSPWRTETPKGGRFWGRRRRALNALVPHCQS